MPRIIDIDAFFEVLEGADTDINECDGYSVRSGFSISKLREIIDGIESAGVEERAEWKRNARGNTYCSRCFSETGTQYEYDRCPACGATMKE